MGKRARQSRWPLSTDRVDALVQRFELLVTVMLARGRQLSAGIADALPSGLMAEAITLPSGLLEVVCEAIMKVTVRTACSDCRAKVGGASKLPSCCRGGMPSTSYTEL